jgi:hypothetical protein
MDVYLDTILLNVLCDQGVEPEDFVQRLATKNQGSSSVATISTSLPRLSEVRDNDVWI